MAIESPAYVISADSHGAQLFRQAAQTMLTSTGVVGANDLTVGQNGTPNMSVNVLPGMVWCPGTLGSGTGMQTNQGAQTAYGLPSVLTTQGSYCSFNDATTNLTISAADPTNPRIDLVCASIQDAQYSGSNNQPVLQIITGTPNPSPAAPSAPASSVVLAQVAVAAGATSITTGNITDERPFVTGTTPRPPLFIAYQNTAQSIGNASWTQIIPDTIAVDTYSGWRGTGSEVYYAQIPGYYLAACRAGFAANTTGVRGAGFAWNSSTVTNMSQVLNNAVSVGGSIVQSTSINYLAAGQYVRFMCYQNSGSTLAMGTGISEFSVTWIHP